MQLLRRVRIGLVALLAILGAGLASAAKADSGTIYISVVKAGWIVSGQGGSGTLTYGGRRYGLSIGGIGAGFTFGAAKAELWGSVRNIRRASDVAGVYGAAGAGVAATRGPGVIVLTNEKGAVLELQGRQRGLMVNVDLSGMVISLR